MRGKDREPTHRDVVAGGGLLHRRLFMKKSLALAGAAGLGAASVPARGQDVVANKFPDWMTGPGLMRETYGQPSSYEAHVKRTLTPAAPISPARGVSLTPLEHMNGMITPNGLHFERHHSSVPEIDPARHQLILHGLVKQPLVFDMDRLLRYPMVSHFYFLECSGNSFANTRPQPAQTSCGAINGLVSCAEWTGVPLSILLEEAGVRSQGKWIIAEGADSVSMVRSIPVEKALDDVIIGLYQNGERLRPAQGYPMRLFVPGWEGNVSVKWLHRLKVTEGPAQSKTETAEYTDLLPDGKARQFTFAMGVKSVITHPSVGMRLPEKGFYGVAGLAWSGHGAISRVEVSADGGKSWADAALDGAPMPKCLTRFRIPWQWDGSPVIFQSRAYDSAGNIQPTREEALSHYSTGNFYHFNGIQSWAVSETGEVANVYA